MKEKNADKNPQLVLRKVCSGLSVISPPKKGSDKNAQLSTCKAELEAMRQRLAVAVGNCSLLESMVERRDQTIEGLRERVRQLEERQTDAELREELREVQRQVEEKTAAICMLKGQLGESEGVRLKLEHQLGEVARARNALHGILHQQMQAQSSASPALPLDSLSQIESRVVTMAQRMADFMQRSWQDSQARVSAQDAAKADVHFDLQTFNLQDVCKPKPPVLAESSVGARIGVEAPSSASPMAPSPDAADEQPIAVRAGRKRRKPGKGNRSISPVEGGVRSSDETGGTGCHAMIVEEVSDQVTLQAPATSKAAIFDGNQTDAPSDEVQQQLADKKFPEEEVAFQESQHPAQATDLDDQWKDIADWLMEGPAPCVPTATPGTDLELTVRLYQEHLRT
eukprot:EG_transcript_9005